MRGDVDEDSDRVRGFGIVGGGGGGVVMRGREAVGLLEAGEEGAVLDELVNEVVVGGWGCEERVSGGYGKGDGFDKRS